MPPNLIEETSELNQTEEIQSPNTNSGVDFDEILPHLGEFGLYQKLLFIMMTPFGLFFAFIYFSQMFMTVAPKQFWCWIPELGNLTAEERRSIAIPPDASNQYGHSQCRSYLANWSDVNFVVTDVNSTWPTVKCQNGYEFNHSEIPYSTITTELGWVCDKNSYVATAQAMFFLGSIVGGMIIGWLADKHGRIPALVASNVFGFIGSVLTIFSKDIIQFSLYRFITGFAYDNCFLMMYILVLEYVGSKYRTLFANMSIALFFGGGCIILPWMSYYIANWRVFTLVTGAPMIIAVLTPFLVPESARWLISQGRIDDALKVIHRIEKVNGTKVPDKLLQDLKASTLNISSDKEANILTVLSRPILRKMFLYIVVVYMACAIVFDALVRLSDTFGLEFHLTFTLTSLTEIPSVTLLSLILDRVGRRWMCTGPMLISSLFSLIAAFTPSGIWTTSCAVIGRFFINMSYNAVMQWATELLPTPVRAATGSAIHVTGYLAALMSPFTVYLENLVPSLPLLIISSIACCGGAIALLLPETLGKDMPHTLEDGEAMMINRNRKKHKRASEKCNSENAEEMKVFNVINT